MVRRVTLFFELWVVLKRTVWVGDCLIACSKAWGKLGHFLAPLSSFLNELEHSDEKLCEVLPPSSIVVALVALESYN